MRAITLDRTVVWKPLVVGLALLFLFSAVLPKLLQDWWADENYSHGLLMPFVIGYIIWAEWDRLRRAVTEPFVKSGIVVILLALGLLLVGTLGSELFTQRVALVVMLAGVALYFFGAQVVRILLVPLLLLLLSIPIPQIIFNNIALPLQMLASKIAGYGITAFGIDASRRGNIIELIPLGTNQLIGLEVVEACGGIRSLMTLAALAVMLVYLTADDRRRSDDGFFSFLKNVDFLRGLVLVLSAVPVALFTNATRVTLTGIATYYWGREAAIGAGHDALGWLTFLAGLALLIIENEVLRRLFARIFRTGDGARDLGSHIPFTLSTSPTRVLAIVVVILIGGAFINWFDRRGEVTASRQPLAEMPRKIGEWWKVGDDTRFSPATEDVLRASDYVMRNYFTVYGRKANLYVGYYESQRTGATYHSPQSCLPGTGWQMTDGKRFTLQTTGGRSLEVNRYIVNRGEHREVMVYWYQGRGRTHASEYTDKIYKVYDSMFMRRSDGAMVRIMTKIYDNNVEAADEGALDLASSMADAITPFVPE
jgi:exosortase D (VPLPA-CTERM-specific)